MAGKLAAQQVRIKRAYEPAAKEDGARILIDRLWPRGIKKEALELSEWNRDLAPSTELRKWFGHDPARWQDFRQRYALELQQQAAALEDLRMLARNGVVTLVYAAHDEAHNDAVVLQALLSGE